MALDVTLPPWVENGILVYGPRKAGTTLFQNLLDGSSQVFAYPAELKLKAFVKNPDRFEDIDAYFNRSRIPEVASPHLSQAHYREVWDTARKTRELHGLAQLIRFDAAAVFASCANAPNQIQMWCAKEVGGPTVKLLKAWRRMFPGSKALFITRDPRMVTRAVLNDRRRKDRRLSWLEIAIETLDPMRVVTAQSRLLDDPGVFVIAYEDLVADTPGVMARVAAFLGVEHTPGFDAPTIFSEPVVVRTASRQTTKVFQQETSWSDGLTGRERRISATVRAVAGLLPAFNVNYSSFRQRLRGAAAS